MVSANSVHLRKCPGCDARAAKTAAEQRFVGRQGVEADAESRSFCVQIDIYTAAR